MQPEGFVFSAGSFPQSPIFGIEFGPTALRTVGSTGFSFGFGGRRDDADASPFAPPPPTPLWRQEFDALPKEKKVEAVERAYYSVNPDTTKVWNVFYDSLGEREKMAIIELANCTKSAELFARAREHLYDATQYVSGSAESMRRLAAAEEEILRVERALGDASLDKNWRGRLLIAIRVLDVRAVALSLIFPRVMGHGDHQMTKKRFRDQRIALVRKLSAALNSLENCVYGNCNPVKTAIAAALGECKLVNLDDEFTDESADATTRDVREDPCFSF